MARHSKTIRDERTCAPVVGARVYVRNQNGDTPVLTNDAGLPIEYAESDEYGAYYFNATSDIYDLEIYYHGRLLTKEAGVVVGAPALATGYIVDSLGSSLSVAPSQRVVTAAFDALAARAGASQVGFAISVDTAPSRTVMDKLRETITPQDFGIQGDGGTYVNAWRRLRDYVNDTSRPGAQIYLPPGTYRLTETMVFTRPVSFVGCGVVQSQIHCYANARIFCDYTRTGIIGTAALNQSVTLRDLALMTDGIHTSGPFYADYSPHSDGSLSPTVLMENVLICGRNPNSGFTTGVELVDAPWVTMTNVVFIGDYGNGSAFLTGTAISLTGNDGSASFKRVRGYSLADAFMLSGAIEGITWDELEFVSCQRGITYADTTDGVQPLAMVTRSHLNCEEYCVKFVGIAQFTVGEGCLFYGQIAKGTASAWTALDITPTLATGGENVVVLDGNISDLLIIGAGAYAATRTGVRIRGVPVGIEDYRIGGCRFESLEEGIHLDAPTNGVLISSDNTFRNVVMAVNDLGNGNLQLQRYLAGSSTGTTDSGGAIAIPFGSHSQFTSPPVIVCSGGDSGQHTYSVIKDTVTTTGFSVVVSLAGTVAGAGLLRRVNWIAVGN